VLINGAPRFSGKSYTATKFALYDKYLYTLSGVKIVGIVKYIGDFESDKPTFSTMVDYVKTIRKIEHDCPYRKLDGTILKILMMSGVAKCCTNIRDIYNDDNCPNPEFQQALTCMHCDYHKLSKDEDDIFEELPEALKNKLHTITTLDPLITRQLADTYSTCPRLIQKYYESICDIVLLTYAMSLVWEPLQESYPYVMYDECHNLLDFNNLAIATFDHDDEKDPALDDLVNHTLDQAVPKVEEEHDLCYMVPLMRKYLFESINIYWTFHNLYAKAEAEGKRPIDDCRHQKEFIDYYNHIWLDDLIKMSDAQIELYKEFRKLYILEWEDATEERAKEIEEHVAFISLMLSIANKHVNIEVENDPRKPDCTVSLKIRAQYPILQASRAKFYITATPYEPQLDKWIFGDEPLCRCHLKCNVKTIARIISEALKKITGEVYYSSNSASYQSHMKYIMGVYNAVRELSMTTFKTARMKKVMGKLTEAGFHADMVIGDTSSEGVQRKADVHLMDGIQIKNIGIDESLAFELGQLYDMNPVNALNHFRKMQNAIKSVQAMCRTFDRNGEVNACVRFGDLMHDGTQTMIEFAKSRWPWLSEDNYQITIIGNDSVDNKIASTISAITSDEQLPYLSAFENQVLSYIKQCDKEHDGEDYLTVRMVCDHFKKSNTTVIKALRNLESYNLIVRLMRTIMRGNQRRKVNFVHTCPKAPDTT
jgi:hypothetical protein